MVRIYTYPTNEAIAGTPEAGDGVQDVQDEYVCDQYRHTGFNTKRKIRYPLMLLTKALVPALVCLQV
jgi:hypothetical protein